MRKLISKYVWFYIVYIYHKKLNRTLYHIVLQHYKYMEDFLDRPCDDSKNIVTPEILAWRLLMDEDIKNCEGIMTPFVSGDELSHDNNIRYDQLSDQFQILIIMYMEMIFGLLKIIHVNTHVNDHEVDKMDLDDTFNPDISNFGIDDMLILFREKFKKIRTFLSIREIYCDDPKNPTDYGLYSEYFCRVILKDTLDGKIYFLKNRNNPDVDSKKRYTFVLKDNTKKTHNKLDDFYAVCVLSNIKVRISFSPITTDD